MASDPTKPALQKLNDFIGEWKAAGGPDKPRPDPRDPTWKESISWSWKFKGSDSWLTMTIRDGKYLKSGELRYQPDKKHYELTVIDTKDQKQVFTGQLDDKGYLTFERTDPTSGDTQQLTMNTAGDGVRFVYRFAVKPKGRTVFTKVYQVAGTKEGESLAAKAAGKKGNECIVTGGLATIAVSYKGQTYYVCCTGCKDAFEENPEKYINAAKK
jgi:YHS domain-containing protein